MKANEFFVRKHNPETGLCFVLMPFDDSLTAVYEHGIKPQIESMGLVCKRADELYTSQGVLSDIWDSLQKAEVIIADCTNKNPNVMYELGLCHALWKKVILLSQHKDDVPFDLRQWRFLLYEFSFAGAARLKEEIGRAVNALQSEETIESSLVPLEVRNKPSINQQAVSGENADWLMGTIDVWKDDRQFGFIKSENESFWFNKSYLFKQDFEISEGQRVVFKPLDAMSNANNRRASDILYEGVMLEGVVTSNFEDRGFSFATANGDNGNSLSVYLETRGVDGIEIETKVSFTISHNKRGPCGVNVETV